jgi:hypothetical protein
MQHMSTSANLLLGFDSSGEEGFGWFILEGVAKPPISVGATDVADSAETSLAMVRNFQSRQETWVGPPASTSAATLPTADGVEFLVGLAGLTPKGIARALRACPEG